MCFVRNTTMAAQQVVDAVNEELLCSICLKRFRMPKMLDCTHSFCENCLDDYVQKKNGKEMTCPICRKVFALPFGVKGLQTNIYLLNLCDKIDLYEKLKPSNLPTGKCENCGLTALVTAFCVDCKNAICRGCESQHSIFEVLKTHSIVRIDSLDQTKLHKLKTSSAAPPCDLHAPEKLRFYCTSCCKLICRECIVILHPKPYHACVEAATQFEDVKTTLTKFLGNCPDQVKFVSKYMTNGESGIDQIKMESSTLVKEIYDSYHKLKGDFLRLLDKRLKDTVDKVKDIQTSKESSIKESITSANNWCKRMNSTKDITEKVSQENNMWEFLSLSQNLINSFQALNDDMSEFQWGKSDLSLETVFTPPDAPHIEFGQCFKIDDYQMPTAVCDANNNFYVCFCDRHNSTIDVKQLRLDKTKYNTDGSYKYVDEEFLFINVNLKDHDKIIKLSATNTNSFFVLAVHQWLVASSDSLQCGFKIEGEDEASIIAICGFKNALYVVYDSNPSTIYQLSSFNSNCKKHRAESGTLNLNELNQIYSGPVITYSVTHNIVHIVSFSDMNTFLIINEDFELVQYDLKNEYALDVKAPDCINSNEKMLAVLNVCRSQSGTSRKVLISEEGYDQHVKVENVDVFILWAGRKKTAMARDSDKRMFISLFETSSYCNSRVWEVSADMGIPRTCQWDRRNDILKVCNASGNVFILQQ